MTPELQNTLAILAQKLGTSIDHLWPVLVAKAKVDAGIGIIWMGSLGLAMAFISLEAYKKLVQKERPYANDADFGLSLLMAICGIATCVLLSCSVSCISDFIYPEAAAIHSLMNK